VTQPTSPSDNETIQAYMRAMRDPQHREKMERTAPFTAEEEATLYRLLDEALDGLEEPPT